MGKAASPTLRPITNPHQIALMIFDPEELPILTPADVGALNLPSTTGAMTLPSYNAIPRFTTPQQILDCPPA